MTSALLIVALLLAVEVSYRLWVRRTLARRANVIDLRRHPSMAALADDETPEESPSGWRRVRRST